MPPTGTVQACTGQTRTQSAAAEEEEGPGNTESVLALELCIELGEGEGGAGAHSLRSPWTQARCVCWFGPGIEGGGRRGSQETRIVTGDCGGKAESGGASWGVTCV